MAATENQQPGLRYHRESRWFVEHGREVLKGCAYCKEQKLDTFRTEILSAVSLSSDEQPLCIYLTRKQVHRNQHKQREQKKADFPEVSSSNKIIGTLRIFGLTSTRVAAG